MAKDETTDVDAPETEEVEEVETDEVETDDTDTDSDADDSADDEEEVVAKADLDKVKGALDKERQLNKDKAAEIRSLKKELKEATAQKPEDVDSQKLVAEAEKTAAKFREIAVRKEATLALNEAGAKVSTTRLMKLLDLDGVEMDNNGNVDGLAEAIEELKEESPEFFKSEDDEEIVTKRVAVKRPGNVDGGKKTAVKPVLTSEQLLLQQAGMKF